MKYTNTEFINFVRKLKSDYLSRKVFKNFVSPGVTIYHPKRLSHLQQIVKRREVDLFVASVTDLKPDLIVDVGAYVGFFSAVGEKYCNTAKIFAIEPNFRNYRLLLKTIAHTENPNITCLHAAAGNHSSIMPLFGGDQGSSLLFSWGGKANGNYIQNLVQVISLAEMIPKQYFEGNVVVKIDAEGLEFEILSDLLPNLSSSKRCHILAEVSLHKNQLNINQHFINVFELVLEFGFDVFPISDTDTPLSLSMIKERVAKAKLDKSEPFPDIEFLFTR